MPPRPRFVIIARIGAGEAVQREQRRQLSFSDELLYQSARKRRSKAGRASKLAESNNDLAVCKTLARRLSGVSSRAHRGVEFQADPAPGPSYSP